MKLLKFISIYLKSFSHKKISYSYGGIDSIIQYIFKNKQNGFYVDVGCGHPIKNNNLKNNCEFIRFNQEEIIQDNNKILNEISSDSLFKKKKIFFINDVTDKLHDIILNIEDLITDQEIYLFSDILEKKSKLSK